MKKFFLFFMVCSGIVNTRLYAGDASSLYELKAEWSDINSKPQRIDVGRGGFVLMSMIYTNCSHACPMTISKIQEIVRKLNEEKIDNVKVVLPSFDLKKDKPKHLHQYVKSRKLDPGQWIFLSPQSEDTIRELAVVLGVNYKDLGNGDFSHSNIVTLLDKEGRIIAKIESLNGDIEPIIKAAKAVH
jgi:protein SCO1/2